MVASSTSITLPANNSDSVASQGLALPTLGIRKNLGPNEIPYPELRETVINILYILTLICVIAKRTICNFPSNARVIITISST